MQGPLVEISCLDNADGSVTYSHSGYLILASVNGPLEVQRRDEMSDEATVEINIRPAAGTAGKILHENFTHKLSLIEV